MKMKTTLNALVLFFSCSAFYAQLPEAPTGYKWVKNEVMSDEFDNQTTLDTDKWHSRLPQWQGRIPAEFLPANVFVKDGVMSIKNTIHPNEVIKSQEPGYVEPDYKGRKEDYTYSIAGGGIESKETQRYGYFEVKMKASKIRMSSTFWLNTNKVFNDATITNPDDGETCGSYGTEIDIIECMGGGSPSWAGVPWTRGMAFNTHFKHRRKLTGQTNCVDRYYSQNALAKDVGENVGDNYHVYAAWWIDANTVNFYLDGVYANTINPNTETYPTPLNVPMSIRMVTETYDWQIARNGDGSFKNYNPGYPTHAELNDDSINTTYYDYIRSYKLVSLDAPDVTVENFDLETGQLVAPWAFWQNVDKGGEIAFEKVTKTDLNGEYIGKMQGPGGLEQIIDVEPNTEYTLIVLAKNTNNVINIGTKDAVGNSGFSQTPVNATEFAETKHTFNPGDNNKIKIFALAGENASGYVDNFSVVKTSTLNTAEFSAIQNDITVIGRNKSIEISLNSSNTELATVKLYSLTGSEVFSNSNVKLSNNTKTISANVVTGIYIVKIDFKVKGTLIKKVTL